LDERSSVPPLDDVIRKELAVALDCRVAELSADETLHVEDCVLGRLEREASTTYRWVDGGLVLGLFADESLGVCEGYIRWGDPVSLV
jgi:hypothetical protein